MALTAAGIADSWRNRAPAERALLAILALLALIAGLYFGVIEPVGEAGARLSARLPALEAERVRVRGEAAELAARGAAPRKLTLDRALVEAALARHGLGGAAGAAAIDATNDGRLRLALPRAPFFAIWPMLQALQNEHGIRAVALRVDRLDASHARVEAVLAAGER